MKVRDVLKMLRAVFISVYGKEDQVERGKFMECGDPAPHSIGCASRILNCKPL
jgi:hypothetical protein